MAKWISEANKKVQLQMMKEVRKYQPPFKWFDGDQVENVTEECTAKVDYYIQSIHKPTNRKLFYALEFRAREYKRNDFYTVFLNVDKWEYGRKIAHQNGTKFIFVVQWEDGLFAIDETHTRIVSDVSEIDLSNVKDARYITMGGRAQMRDANDVDKPVVNIPVQHFIPISEFPIIVEE